MTTHSHHYSTTEVSPDLGKMAKTIGDVSVQIMPLRYLGKMTKTIGAVSVQIMPLRYV